MSIEKHLEKMILGKWPCFYDEEPPKNIDFNILSSFVSRDLKLSPAIIFANAVTTDKKKPVFIIKMQRDPAVDIVKLSLEHEFKALQTMSKNNIFARFVPSPVFSGVMEGHMLNVETIIKGTTLNDLLVGVASREDVSLHLRKVLILLKDLYFSTYVSDESYSNFCSRFLSPELNMFSDVLKDYSVYFKGYFSFDEKNVVLPLYSQHGDFFVSNILFDKHEISGIIDFEDFSAKGLPMGDLYNFLITYIFSLKRTGVDKKLNFGDWFIDLVGGIVSDYAKNAKIPEEVHDDLFRAYVLHSINREMGPRRNNLELARFLMNSFKDKPKNVFDFMKSYLNM